jgi:hypothetical protein
MSRFCAVTSAACGRAPNRRVLSGLVILLGATGLMFLAGCGANGALNLSGGGSSTESQGASIKGTVYGGQAPVTGATVTLYAAGTSGYGSAAVQLAQTTTSSTPGSLGSFTLPAYTCPAAPGDLTFLVATSGNPGNAGGQTNPNLVQLAALGSCHASGFTSQFVWMDEVTTVASTYSLAQFLSYTSGSIDTFPASSVTAGTVPFIGIPTSGTSCNAADNWTSTGAHTCNYVGLANAMALVKNMVSLSTGNVPSNSEVPSYTAAGINPGNDSYVPSARINTLANILSSCVNSTGGVANDGSNCGTLFGATTPASTTIAPTDTLQAIWNLAQKPSLSSTNNTALFGLVTKNPAFSTPASLTSAPNDWTLVLGYTSGGFINNVYGPSADSGYSGGLSIDQQGNLWAMSEGDDGMTSQGGIVGLTNQGVPISPNTNTTTWGAFQSGADAAFPWGDPAIALNGDIYFGNLGSGTFTGINQAGAQVLAPVTTPFGAGGGYPTGQALDTSGNFWVVGTPNGSTQVQAIKYSSSGSTLESPAAYPDGVVAEYSGVAIDNNGDVWFSTSNGDIQASESTGALTHYYAGSNNYGQLQVTSAGDVFGCNTGYIFEDEPPSSFVQLPGINGCNVGNEFAPNAIDGNGNLWEPVLSDTESGSVAHLNEVSSVGPSYSLLSPATTGYQGIGVAAGGGTTDGEGAYYLLEQGPGGAQNLMTGAQVDGSGNVWILNGYANVPGNVATEQLVEFVGLGAPTVQPTSLALQYNTFTQLP